MGSKTHCSGAERPDWATHRIIYSLYVEFVPLPDEPPDKTTALCIPLTRGGMPPGPDAGGNGRPRPPELRTIDLRVGDEILSTGLWSTIRSMAVYRGFWLTDEQAARQEPNGDGYLYRLSPSSP